MIESGEFQRSSTASVCEDPGLVAHRGGQGSVPLSEMARGLTAPRRPNTYTRRYAIDRLAGLAATRALVTNPFLF